MGRYGACEDAGYEAFLLRVEGARVHQPIDRFVEHSGRARGAGELMCTAVQRGEVKVVSDSTRRYINK